MFSITATIFAGDEDERSLFENMRPVATADQALQEIHAGHNVWLPKTSWQVTARSILMGLGAPEEWAADVVSHAVEFQRVPHLAPVPLEAA